MSEENATTPSSAMSVEEDVSMEMQKKVEMEYYELIFPNFLACWKRGDYCDVNVKVGQTVFKCHRLLLAANSPYFVSLFKNDFREGEEDTKTLPSEYVDENSFSKLLNAMYKEPFEIEGDLVPLFTTSVYLQLTHFMLRLQRYIIKNLDSIDAIELLMLPEVQINKELYAVVKKHICHNFSKLYSHMAEISLEVFEDLFTDPELFVTSKDQVLDFGKKWISHNIQNRKIHLQKVASLLKPFHAPSDQLLELVNYLVKQVHTDYDVKVALNNLLEFTVNVIQNEHKLEVPDPFFFVQPNSKSEIIFGTYKDDAWVFLNKFQLPVATDLLIDYEGAMVNDIIYLSAERRMYCDSGIKSNVIFHGFLGETGEWVELISPRSMPQCLIACNETVYSYEHSLDDYQISVFEPFLNRWLKVPAVNYPRINAGIASRRNVLYMVGGIPCKQIASATPTNIIEMYDSRCGNWSRILMPNQHTIANQDYSNLVCINDDKLFMVDRETLEIFIIDLRNNRWLFNEDGPIPIAKPVCGHLVSVYKGTPMHKLWFIDVDATRGIHELDPDVDGDENIIIPNPNVFIKPISLPSN